MGFNSGFKGLITGDILCCYNWATHFQLTRRWKKFFVGKHRYNKWTVVFRLGARYIARPTI